MNNQRYTDAIFKIEFACSWIVTGAHDILQGTEFMQTVKTVEHSNLQHYGLLKSKQLFLESIAWMSK